MPRQFLLKRFINDAVAPIWICFLPTSCYILFFGSSLKVCCRLTAKAWKCCSLRFRLLYCWFFTMYVLKLKLFVQMTHTDLLRSNSANFCPQILFFYTWFNNLPKRCSCSEWDEQLSLNQTSALSCCNPEIISFKKWRDLFLSQNKADESSRNWECI